MQRDDLSNILSALQSSVRAMGESALLSQTNAIDSSFATARDLQNTQTVTPALPYTRLQPDETEIVAPQNSPLLAAQAEEKDIRPPAPIHNLPPITLSELLAIDSALNLQMLEPSNQTQAQLGIYQGEKSLHAFKEFADYHDDILAIAQSHRGEQRGFFALNLEAEEERELANLDKRTSELDSSVLPVLNPSLLNNQKSYWLFYLVPASTGCLEAADVIMSLASAEYSWAIISIGATIAFFAAIGLTGKTAQHNFTLLKNCVQHRAMPHEWPRLSRTKLRIALAINAVTLPAGPVAEMMQTVFLINSIPALFNIKNRFVQKTVLGVSIPIAILVGTNKLLTDNVEGLSITVRLLAGKMVPYISRFSAIISPMFGITLGVFKALDDCIQAYIAYTQNFHINTAIAKRAILAANLTIAPPSFSFTGILYINSFDKLIGYLTRAKFKKADVAGFMLTLGLAVSLSYMMQPLNRSFYEKAAIDFNFSDSLHSLWYDLFSWVIFAQKTVEVTASNTSDVIEFLEKLPARMKRLYDYCATYWQNAPQPAVTTGFNLVHKEPAKVDSDPDQKSKNTPAATSSSINHDDDFGMARITISAKSADEKSPLLANSMFGRKATRDAIPRAEKKWGCGIQ